MKGINTMRCKLYAVRTSAFSRYGFETKEAALKYANYYCAGMKWELEEYFLDL